MTITTAAEAIEALEKWRKSNQNVKRSYSVATSDVPGAEPYGMLFVGVRCVECVNRGSFADALIELARKAQGE